jgi:hypothetical protein
MIWSAAALKTFVLHFFAFLRFRGFSFRSGLVQGGTVEQPALVFAGVDCVFFAG